MVRGEFMREREIQEYDNSIQTVYLNAVISAQQKIDRYKKNVMHIHIIWDNAKEKLN